MSSLFQDKIVEVLNNDNVIARNYFGELKDPKKYQAPTNDKPIIYVNYTKDEPDANNLYKSKYTYDLYVVHVAYSLNETNKNLTHKSIHNVMNHIRESLQFNSFCDSELIRLKKGEKIFDAPTNGKYLTVYKRTIEVVIVEPQNQTKGLE